MSRGKLITIEGIDGTGKTTLARALSEALQARGTATRLLREPGGVRASELIRDLLKDPSVHLGDRTEALLYAAARAQLVDEALVPLLEAGTWVVLDRFADSSLAYQGAGRSLGVEAVRAINEFAVGSLRPDLTLLLRAELPVARRRSSGRGQPADRHERLDDGFFERVDRAYAELATAQPERYRVLDASRAPDTVLRQALEELQPLMRPCGGGRRET